MSSLRVAAAIAVLSMSARVDAGDGDVLRQLVFDVRARLDAAIAARPPTLVPPVKANLKWRLAKLGTVDLGAPLVALTAGDLDGDGKSELYAVTSREVIALGLRGKKLEEIGRVAFFGDRAIPAPRDVVATAIVDGGAVVASVSTWTRSLRVRWDKKALVGQLGEPGFTLCPGEIAQLAPGRDYFGDEKTGRYSAYCNAALVAPDGHPMRVRGNVTVANKLAVSVETCVAPGVTCANAGQFEYGNAGVAFALGDLDRDGAAEAIFAGAGAPGDPDKLTVVTLGDDDKKHAKLKKQFAAGGIAGITIADLDGDHLADAVAAVRIVGATRVDLWRIE